MTYMYSRYICIHTCTCIYHISSKSRQGEILFQGSVWCCDNLRAVSTEIDMHARTQLQ